MSDAPSMEPACADETAALDTAADMAQGFEGFSAVPYRCPAGVWTIGYGSTRDIHGVPVSRGTSYVTREQAHAMMVTDLRGALQAVNKGVMVSLEPYEEAALIDFIYNVGSGAFAKSGLLRAINAGDFDIAADEFLKWNRGAGRVLAGLVKRRAAERYEFLKTA